MEWLYTAITRCIDLNNVSCFENIEAEQDRVEQKVLNYFKNKIEGYGQQDRKAGRELNSDNMLVWNGVWIEYHQHVVSVDTIFILKLKSEYK